MTRRRLLPLTLTLATAICAACDGPLIRPPTDHSLASPATIVDFEVLYTTNCAGCHGPQGEGGVALGLGNPVYLAIADDATLRRVTGNGVAGTGMPAFAQTAGGLLTDMQVEAIARGIRVRWARPALLDGTDPPPHVAAAPGDQTRGAGAYGQFCASCHGATGRGASVAGSIVDGSYLRLVSDQSLRTTIIAGRPDIGHPDWRSNASGRPMSPEDVSDVTAWLVAQRPLANKRDQSRKDTP